MLCVLDIEGSNVSVLEGVPEDISPGQVSAIVFFFFPFAVCFSLMFTLFKYPHNILFFLSFTLGITLFLYLQAFWAPGDTGVVFVGWWHEPFRLGLKYCPNRR